MEIKYNSKNRLYNNYYQQKRIKFLFFTLLLYTSSSIGQYNSYKDIINTDGFNDTLKSLKIDSLIKQNIRDHQLEDIEIITHQSSNWHYRRKRVAKAIAALKLSIKYHNTSITHDEDLDYKNFKVGFFYNKLKDFENSIKAYKRVYHLNDSSKYAGQAYYNIGLNYYKLGDYQISRTYYELAEKVLIKVKNYNRLINCYSLSYNTYSKIGSKDALEKLESNLLKADSLKSIITISKKGKFNIKQALSSYYIDTKNVNKGLSFALEFLNLAKKEKDSSRITSAYTELGLLHESTNPKKALNYHKEALKYCPTSEQYNLSIVYTNLGVNNAHLGHYALSISQQLQSLRIYTDTDFKNTSPEEISHILNEKFDDINLYSKLANIGESYLLYAEKTKNKDTLQEAIKYFRLADNTIDIYHKNSKTNSSKLIWQRKATEMYGRALKACYLAGDYSSAFAFMEKNKALLLYKEQKKQKRLQELQLPESFISKERHFTNKLNEYAKIKNKDIITLKREISYHDSLISLTNNIKSTHKNIQLDFKNIPYDDVVLQIEENEAVLQYHTPIDEGYGIYPNSTNGYGILITKNKTHFFEIDSMQFFKDKVNQLHTKNTSPINTKREVHEYNILAHRIYKKLFPTKEIQKDIEGKKLTIIPDNYLTTIPFESLIVSSGIQNDYLIKHAEIHYKYSYTFHEETKSNLNDLSSDITAFAPIVFNNYKLSSLLNSEQEINHIKSYYNGTFYSGKEATKTAFKKALNSSNIIHLATHANAIDSLVPWVAFSDQKLYLDELYSLKNNAYLIFLSACKTSSGKIETGEGTMSLSRGFFYGGAQSTISSLWKVDDKSTQYIVNAFYKNLQNGASKSLALHQAKLEYLKNHTGSEIAPYYWASLVLIGDTSPLPQESWFWYYIISGGLILVLLFLLSRKRKKQPSY